METPAYHQKIIRKSSKCIVVVFFHPCGLEILTFARWNWLGHWGLKIAGGLPNWNPPSFGSFLHMFIHFPCSKSFPTHILHEALNLWVNLQHHWTMTPERNMFDLSWDRNHRTGYPGNFQCRLEPSSELLFVQRWAMSKSTGGEMMIFPIFR